MPLYSFDSMIPIIDDDNPMYCPEVSAHQYIASVRLFEAALEEEKERQNKNSASPMEHFPYLHKLRLAFDSDVSLYAPDLEEAKKPTLINAINDSSALDFGSLLESPITRNSAAAQTKIYLTATDVSANAKHKRKSTGTDSSDSSSFDAHDLLAHAAKRVKRSSSEVAQSFVLSARAARLQLACFESTDPDAHVSNDDKMYWPDSEMQHYKNSPRINGDKKKCTCGAWKTLQGLPPLIYAFLGESGQIANEDCSHLILDELYGPEVGFQTPRSVLRLVNKIQSLLTGVHVREQLHGLTTHQDIVNILGLKGHLSYPVLSLLRKAKVFELNLAESINDADGLNLGGSEILKVFKSPNSFIHLQKLVLSDVPLADGDILNFNELPGLESLFIDNTQISDEAVMHLVALKYTLTYLDLSWNDSITDDSIPALCALRQLEVISLKGTNITMDGLRKFSWSVKQQEEDRKVSLIVPTECELYLYDMHNHYALVVPLEFATEPHQVHQLTLAEVKRNLEEHTKRNPKISVEGTAEDLAVRLRDLLDRRQKDFAARSFLVQSLV